MSSCDAGTSSRPTSGDAIDAGSSSMIVGVVAGQRSDERTEKAPREIFYPRSSNPSVIADPTRAAIRPRPSRRATPRDTTDETRRQTTVDAHTARLHARSGSHNHTTYQSGAFKLRTRRARLTYLLSLCPTGPPHWQRPDRWPQCPGSASRQREQRLSHTSVLSSASSTSDYAGHANRRHACMRSSDRVRPLPWVVVCSLTRRSRALQSGSCCSRAPRPLAAARARTSAAPHTAARRGM